MKKPYHDIIIEECGEPLISIPTGELVLELPHPYKSLGADYGDKSPYCLRLGVVNALLEAQRHLQLLQPGWRLKIFDAYRPVSVQQFMVDYTFAQVVQKQGVNPKELSEENTQAIWQQVYEIWAMPSNNPATPPPHSTGAAVDLTLVDEKGQTVDFGGEIDELSMRSHPNYYLHSGTEEGQIYDARRELLHQVMTQGGFLRHPGEWWHFSLGDQMWTWQHNLEHYDLPLTARYGRV